MFLTRLRYIKKEEEVRIGRILDRTGNRSFSRECSYNSNRGYGQGRGYFRRGVFEVGTVVILEETIVGIVIEKIGDLRDSPDLEKEE